MIAAAGDGFASIPLPDAMVLDGREGRMTVCAPLATPSAGVACSRGIDTSGRVWWSLDTVWPLFPRSPYLVSPTP